MRSSFQDCVNFVAEKIRLEPKNSELWRSTSAKCKFRTEYQFVSVARQIGLSWNFVISNLSLVMIKLYACTIFFFLI